MHKPDCSLIIVAWDNLIHTSRFVKQCLDQEVTVGDIEVILVDNGSTDGTQEWWATIPQNDRYGVCVRNAENLGYPAALNQGLQMARGEYLVCLNNDIIVRTKGAWLQDFLQPLRWDKKILLGARMIHGNAIVEVDGWVPSYLEGWCLAFHRDFLDDVGYFDEVYSPAFVEDVDICWRATRHGYDVVQSPCFDWTPQGYMIRGVLYHIYGQTTYVPRDMGGHMEDTRHHEITPIHAAAFRAKVRAGDDRIIRP